MSQDLLREKLNNYLRENGIKAQFVADRIGLNKTTISLFRKDKRDIKQCYLVKLEELLQ